MSEESPVPADAPADSPTGDGPAAHAPAATLPAPAAPPAHAARTSRLAAAARPVPMLALALVASLLLSLFLLIRGPGEESDSGRQDVLGVAETYAINLTSYDFARIDEDFGRVLDNATGQFKSEYEVAKESLREAIVKFQGKATGTVLARAVLSFDDGRAEVLLFVDQTVTNANTAQPRIDRLRMRMGLEKQSGRWLINKLDLV